MPDHPQKELYEQLCGEYRNLSEKLLKKHIEQVEFVSNVKLREKKLDEAFVAKLKQMEDEEDSVSADLPKLKRTAQ